MIVIRKARETDCKDVKQLELVCELCSWSVADYIAETKRTDSVFLTALADDVVVGFLLARLLQTGDADDEREFDLYNIATHPDYRRQRIAVSLLNELPRGIPVNLEVRSQNAAAIAFYKRMCFLESGRRARFYSNPTDDAILMRRGRWYP